MESNIQSPHQISALKTSTEVITSFKSAGFNQNEENRLISADKTSRINQIVKVEYLRTIHLFQKNLGICWRLTGFKGNKKVERFRFRIYR